MKTFTIALVLCLSTHAFAFPYPSDDEIKKAKQECNATIPVTRDPLAVLAQAIVETTEVDLSHNEKCFIDCYMKKINATDATGAFYEDKFDGTMRDAESVGMDNVMVSAVMVLNRSTKYMTDQCERAFVNLAQVTTQQVVLLIAKLGEVLPTSKGQIYNPVKNGNKVDVKLEQKRKRNSNFLVRTVEFHVREMIKKYKSHA